MDLNNYINKLEKLLSDNNVCNSHGIGHSISVLNNARMALDSQKYSITSNERNMVLLAALLHDADDRKFFPNNKNYENVREILKGENQEFIDGIIKMIDLVSSSKNGDNIPDGMLEWMLIPRYADRLEAIGLIGIKRCWKYGKTTSNPLHTPNTPRPETEEEIWKLASEERYKSYKGSSDSMIDHFYDKLLRASKFPIRNIYFDIESKIRQKPLIDFLLYFSKKSNLSDNDVIDFIDKYQMLNIKFMNF
jgi:uncharacterized protein